MIRVTILIVIWRSIPKWYLGPSGLFSNVISPMLGGPGDGARVKCCHDAEAGRQHPRGMAVDNGLISACSKFQDRAFRNPRVTSYAAYPKAI